MIVVAQERSSQSFRRGSESMRGEGFCSALAQRIRKTAQKGGKAGSENRWTRDTGLASA